MHEFSITLRATSDTDKAISTDTFCTLLHPRSYVFGHKGFTFKDIESNVRIKRPDLEICYFEADTIMVRIPARGAQSPYSVTHKMKLWNQQAMRDINDHVEATRDPNHEPKQSSDRMWGPTADFEVGHSYEIGLGDIFGQLYQWEACPSWSWWNWLGWRGKSEEVDDRTAGKMPMVLMNKVIIRVIE